MNAESTMQEIQSLEKAITASQNLRSEAITKRSMWTEQVKEKDKELASLGTTPEKGRQEIENIDKEIASLTEQIRSMLPIDLLTKYGKM